MKLAIVILNWNGRQMLERYLPSVVAEVPTDCAVYVADNASTDDSLVLLRNHFPQVRLIVLDTNYGFAEGYNKALGQIEAEYYLLLNSDVQVTPHWLRPLLLFMDQNPGVAACQPKLLSMADHGQFEYAGACGGFIDRYGYPYCRGRIFDTVENDAGQYDTPMPIQWATGACLLIRSADYWNAGGLDGRFFAHNEEIDLCWRLRLTGRQIYCVPQSQVYHVGGGTLNKSNPRKTYLNFRNNLTMLYKNLPDSDLRRVMRVRWLLDYVAAIEMLLLQHSWGDFMAVVRARRAFHAWRHQFEADRDRIQRSRISQSDDVRSPYSILWQYYVHHKRTFAEFQPQTQVERKTIPNVMLLPNVADLLAEGHTVTLPLRGNSMRPFLEDNRDKGLLIKAGDFSVGDAVLAQVAPGTYVLHRIVRIKGDAITLCGDGNLNNEYCRRQDVIGFVVGFYRKGRTRLDRTNGLKWALYSVVWMSLRPVRRYLLAAYRRIWLKLFKPI